jgi:hypothetical protein
MEHSRVHGTPREQFIRSGLEAAIKVEFCGKAVPSVINPARGDAWSYDSHIAPCIEASLAGAG